MCRVVSSAGDFSAVSHRGQVGWREFVACRFYRRGFLDFGYAFARNNIGVSMFYNVISVKRGITVSHNSVLRCHFDRSEGFYPNAVEKSPTEEV